MTCKRTNSHAVADGKEIRLHLSITTRAANVSMPDTGRPAGCPPVTESGSKLQLLQEVH